MKRVIWRCIGHQPSIRKLAACFDGSLYALDSTGRLLVNHNLGLDEAWQWERDLPSDAANLTCAARNIYYQTSDRTLWYLSGNSGPIRAGQPWAASEIAGTEDATADVPVLWALNNDKSLWRNDTNGADSQWHRVGLPHSALKIAAAQSTLFALNFDGSFWANDGGGLDGAWERLGAAAGATEITATSDGRSGAIQLYALHHDSSLWQGVIVERCRVSLATQSSYPTSNCYADWSSLADLGDLGIGMHVWTMSGDALQTRQGDSLDEFLGYDESAIRGALTDYLKDHRHLSPGTKGLVILDMESPVHPASFGLPQQQLRLEEIVTKFKLRIQIARQELPKARLALYGVIVPNPHGSVNEPFRQRMKGYQLAAELGLFDEVDYLSPVLYTRWGPDDDCGGTGKRGYCSVAAHIRAGITYTASLASKPLVPLLSLRVANSESRNSAHPVAAEIARSQLGYLQSRPEVARIVYWVPRRPSNNLYSPPDEILAFFRGVNACGR